MRLKLELANNGTVGKYKYGKNAYKGNRMSTMISRAYDMNGKNEGFHVFIDASRRASQKGDLRQAERLLKTSLKNVEQQVILFEAAIKEIVESLLELYRCQHGRDDEIHALENKLRELKSYRKVFDGFEDNRVEFTKEDKQ
jgi:hypothetical protein